MISFLRRLRRKDQSLEADAHFKNRYEHFKALLDSNSELLNIITDLETKLGGTDLFGMSYIRSQSSRIVFHASRMIKSYNVLSNNRFPELPQILDSIRARISAILEQRHSGNVDHVVLPLSSVDRNMVDSTGGKSANLGEIRNKVGLPVPPGFAITTKGFQVFMDQDQLLPDTRKILMEVDPADPGSLTRAGEAIQHLFLTAPLPSELAEGIMQEYKKLCSETENRELHVALRSSAVGEDGELSFAGQYLTVLNVPAERILKSYKMVLASLFTPRAIAYRLHKGIPFEHATMAVACLAMIPSATSGVCYSRHPYDPLQNMIIINAVRGLGSYAVDGTVPPDTYVVTKENPPRIVDRTIVPKHLRLTPRPEGFVHEEEIPENERGQTCLNDEKILLLARYALKLEDHYGIAQDIEWAICPEGKLYVLQARPLNIQPLDEVHLQMPALAGHKVLIQGGEAACPGVGYGQAHVVEGDQELANVPDGAVLVAEHSSPRYSLLMSNISAVVTDSGSITGHMASIAREFGVPALLNTDRATKTIEHGSLITVDAYGRRVFEGRVPELDDLLRKRSHVMVDTPVFKTLRQVCDVITPLNLVDPESPDFKPGSCKTVHDIMRLLHEHSYKTMFNISDLASGRGTMARKLQAPIPLDLYLIDLGGGLSGQGHKLKKVGIEQVTSAPFAALVQGMLHEDLREREPRPVTVDGFLSVMSKQLLGPPPTSERFGDRSYAIISDKYCNFSSRIGYHYSILDSYCSRVINNNYIHFEFKGGAADDVRRNRRARAIASILTTLGFKVEVNRDRVFARYLKEEEHMILEKLNRLGSLLIYTRQLDMLMTSESSVEELSRCFLEENYCFRAPEPPGRKVP